MTGAPRITAKVIGSSIDVLNWEEAIARISNWAQARESRVVCICNVHSVVTAYSDSELRDALDGADMATPDGAPVAFMLRRAGYRSQERINGPDLMLKSCAQAAKSGVGVYLYGASQKTLDMLRERLSAEFPALRIVGAFSPPFRALSDQESAETVQRINESGAGLVWVGLGCPKQEKWMTHHRGRINAVMVGVGAAFDYHAGTLTRAPLWMQRNGLEWLYRLIADPRRLWRRYFITNSIFICYAAVQLLRDKVGINPRGVRG